jgi:hypothetical protein
MKLGDGRKVKIHESPECDERDGLSSECSQLLTEWLRWTDEVRQTEKNTSSYTRQVTQMKEAESKLNAANSKRSQHISEHGCR